MKIKMEIEIKTKEEQQRVARMLSDEYGSLESLIQENEILKKKLKAESDYVKDLEKELDIAKGRISKHSGKPPLVKLRKRKKNPDIPGPRQNDQQKPWYYIYSGAGRFSKKLYATMKTQVKERLYRAGEIGKLDMDDLEGNGNFMGFLVTDDKYEELFNKLNGRKVDISLYDKDGHLLLNKK